MAGGKKVFGGRGLLIWLPNLVATMGNTRGPLIIIRNMRCNISETFWLFLFIEGRWAWRGIWTLATCGSLVGRTKSFSWIFSVLEGGLCLQMGWPPVFGNDTWFNDGKTVYFALKMWMVTVLQGAGFPFGPQRLAGGLWHCSGPLGFGCVQRDDFTAW